jgi:hypothetical protein
MILAAQPQPGLASGTDGSQSPSAPSSSQAPKTGPQQSAHAARAVRIHPAITQLAVGIALIAASIVAYWLTESGLDQERFSFLTLSLAGLSAVVALFESTQILLSRDRFSNPLSLFPGAGVALISLAAVATATISPGPANWAMTTGPALAAGVFLVIRASIVRYCNTDRNGGHLFFPAHYVPSQVKLGDLFTLQPGMVAPVDARIDSGSCALLERYLSPEPHFTVKDETDIVFAGSEVVGGQAQLTALSGYEDSCLRSLERLVEPKLEKVGTSLLQEDLRARTATAYILLFISVASAILWDERAGRAWEVLSAAGLVLFSSVVYQLGDLLFARRRELGRSWARRGLVITSESSIRNLCAVSKVLIDPSRLDVGSLIEARELEILDDRVGREELCECLASVLGRAEDPALAAAGDLCQRVAGAITPERALSFKEYGGSGASGTVRGVPVTIGTEELLVERGILIHPSESSIEVPADERALLVAIGGELVARFWIKFGQAALFTGQDGRSPWEPGVQAGISQGTVGEVTASTLLVRGQESDVLGRGAPAEVALFSGDRFELPKAAVVALVPRLYALPSLLRECNAQARLIERGRVLIAFGTFVSISVVFLGFFSPLVASLAVALVAAVLFLL